MPPLKVFGIAPHGRFWFEVISGPEQIQVLLHSGVDVQKFHYAGAVSLLNQFYVLKDPKIRLRLQGCSGPSVPAVV